VAQKVRPLRFIAQFSAALHIRDDVAISNKSTSQ